MIQKFRVCGIDEAGRGALAGSLFAAAVILTDSLYIQLKKLKMPIKDSKILSSNMRSKIVEKLNILHVPYIVESVSERRINNHGIQKANKEIIKNLIRRMNADTYVVDGNLKLGRIRGKTGNVTCIKHADATIPAVILAGIVAKVKRDAYMKQLSVRYPQYLWHTNAGYGTVGHIHAIITHGTCRYHRNIFVTTALRHKQSNSHAIIE